MNTWRLRLNDALKARNKTVADLSRATGVSSAGVKKWVEGRVLQPKFDDVVAICDFLDIYSRMVNIYERLGKIERNLDKFATKDDLHTLTWRVIGVCAALVAVVYYIATQVR